MEKNHISLEDALKLEKGQEVFVDLELWPPANMNFESGWYTLLEDPERQESSSHITRSDDNVLLALSRGKTKINLSYQWISEVKPKFQTKSEPDTRYKSQVG